MSRMESSTLELLALQEVSVNYPRRRRWMWSHSYQALSNVSLSVFQGETLGIIGRNGVGKTTLLRLLAGIITPDGGQCWRRRQVRTALLSLQAGFIPVLTGRQNAVISGMALGLSKRRILACMTQIIEFSELHSFIDEPVAAYSAGMRARLGFSVAMHVAPDILLVDEVISVGDEAFRNKSARVIHDRVAEQQTTVLVTHNVHLARSLCTRLVWLDGGRVRMSGATETVLDAYLA